MRARMALKLANINVEIREISLRNKPKNMLALSPKGTVPVLVLPDGGVIEESLDIMHWALARHALEASIHADCRALVLECDTGFKQALDAYKYPERHLEKTQTQYRTDGEVFLLKLETLLQKNQYLFNATPGFADITIFPFVRQFGAVDEKWFEMAPYPQLRVWLKKWVESELFVSIMQKQPTYIE